LLLIGDSNVRRSINHLGSMYTKMVQYLPCRRMSELDQSLTAVSSKYNLVVLSMLTNIIVDAGDKPKDGESRDTAIQNAISDALEQIQ